MISKSSSADFYRPNDVMDVEIWNALNPKKKKRIGVGKMTHLVEMMRLPRPSGNNLLAGTAGSPG